MMGEHTRPQPKISVLLPFGGQARRAEDALRALSTRMQRNVAEEDYEVLALEWDSTDPLGQQRALAESANVRYFRRPTAPDPLEAARFALSVARAPFIGLVSGAVPLLTPRTLEHALLAAEVDPDPLVVVPSYHLFETRQDPLGGKTPEGGPESESRDVVDWETDGYRLFEFAQFAKSFERGFLSPFVDVMCLFVRRESLESVLGEHADRTGTIFGRLASRPETRLVILGGEGAFADAPDAEAEGREPRKPPAVPARKHAVPTREPLVLGVLPGQAQRFVIDSANWAVIFHALAGKNGGSSYPMDP